MSDDCIYAEYTPELFEAASELMMNKYFMAKKVKDQQIYDLTIKALEYYREYLDNNQPFDTTTSTYSSRLTNKATYVPYVKDAIVIPKQAITNWEVQDCNGIRHSKVEFLNSLTQYDGGFL